MISRKSLRVKASAAARRYAAERGWHVFSVCQPQHLFRKEIERRHSRVADARDPWWATVGDCEHYLSAEKVRHGQGDTPDAAVLAAIPHDIRASLRRLEAAVDSLRDCLQK